MLGFLGQPRNAGHRFCQENLSAFLDGELKARDRERIRQHLEVCEACRWELQTLQETVNLVRSLPQVKAPRSFRIPHSAPAPSVPFWMRPAAYSALRVATGAVAAALVIALAGHAVGVAPSPAAAPATLMAERQAVEVPAADQATQGANAQGEPALTGPALPTEPGVGIAAEAAPAPTEGDGLAAGAPQPTLAGERGLAEPEGTPTGPLGLGGGAPPSTDTLTPEEAIRATNAPPGMGGGALPTGTVAAPKAAETATPPPAPVEPAAVPSAAAEPTSEARFAPTAPREPHAPDGWTAMRQRLGVYPWATWAAASGGLLAVLLAATLWLRTARARWP